jgi:hypothetical protein
MAKKIFNAICFFHDPIKNPLKYRNVYDDSNFLKFINNKGCRYINFYFASNKKFSHRIYCDPSNIKNAANNAAWIEYLSK